MSYLTQSKLAFDGFIADRVAACVAQHGESDPAGWVMTQRWVLSVQPGWDAAYAAALAGGVKDPGADESAVTGSMISDAVTALLSKETPSE